MLDVWCTVSMCLTCISYIVHLQRGEDDGRERGCWFGEGREGGSCVDKEGWGVKTETRLAVTSSSLGGIVEGTVMAEGRA